MTSLFSAKGIRQLRDFGQAENVLYAFDYDGTLSEIVAHPGDAHLSQKIRAQLSELSRQTTVAVISGRAKNDLTLRLPKGIHHLIGNHGLESGATSHALELRCKELTLQWAKLFKDQEAELIKEGARGFETENKGLSFTLHYRNCFNAKKAKQVLLKFIYQLEPLPRVIDGKSVLNLVPQGSPHKGMALLNLMRKLQIDRALYIGDDATDEDVFNLHDERILTVRIGKKKNSQAQFYLKSQHEIGLLLSRLLENTAVETRQNEGKNAKKSVGL